MVFLRWGLEQRYVGNWNRSCQYGRRTSKGWCGALFALVHTARPSPFLVFHAAGCEGTASRAVTALMASSISVTITDKRGRTPHYDGGRLLSEIWLRRFGSDPCFAVGCLREKHNSARRPVADDFQPDIDGREPRCGLFGGCRDRRTDERSDIGFDWILDSCSSARQFYGCR
jgi:hypothetical protein